MAEKSKVKWKKWVVALAILVAIAIVVLVVVFTIPKDTNKVKATVASHEETALLKDENETKLFNTLKTKVNQNANGYYAQVQNVEKVATTVQNVLTFYDDYIYLVNHNKTFQSQYNVIMKAFSQADSYQKELDNLLVQVDEQVNQSPDYTTWAWGQFVIRFEGYTTSYADAFRALAKVFYDCIPQGVINHELTYRVLDTVSEYLIATAETDFNNAYCVNHFAQFVSNFLASNGAVTKNSPINKYVYTQSLQDAFAQVKEFYSIYKDVTFKDVIKTAVSGGFSYEKSEADADDVLSHVKTFLKGGLS